MTSPHPRLATAPEFGCPNSRRARAKTGASCDTPWRAGAPRSSPKPYSRAPDLSGGVAYAFSPATAARAPGGRGRPDRFACAARRRAGRRGRAPVVHAPLPRARIAPQVRASALPVLVIVSGPALQGASSASELPRAPRAHGRLRLVLPDFRVTFGGQLGTSSECQLSRLRGGVSSAARGASRADGTTDRFHLSQRGRRIARNWGHVDRDIGLDEVVASLGVRLVLQLDAADVAGQ